MFYDRKIRYLDYWANGERIRSVGFVKIEIIDAICNIQVQINGLNLWGYLKREIRIYGKMQESGTKKETSLGEIALENGKGDWRLRHQKIEALGDDALPLSGLQELVIELGGDKKLICVWNENICKSLQAAKKESEQKEEIKEEEKRKGQERIDDKIEIEGQVGIEREEKREKPEETERENKKELEEKECATEQEIWEEEQKEEIVPEADMHAAQMRPRARLYEDKWQQLSSIYPHIVPFEDERDYLSITPADFVVLQKQYQRLVSNSFLLHGFYNYDHLILTRTVRAGEVRYYVGVPGNFYEKERQVAIMFGFESFECKREPVEAGDFGYYCIRVDI